MSPTRVVVVGLGAIAFEHLARLRARADVEIVAVCDRSATVMRAMAERFGVPAGDADFDAVLDAARPAAVHILTPPASHRALVVAALERGAHVLVEKPAAPSGAAYAEMRAASLAADRMLVENHNYRFTPALQRAQAEIGAGRLGDLVGVDVAFTGVMGGAYADRDAPHFAHALPGGALRNFLTHPVSIAVGLLGAPEQVHVVRRRLDPAFASDDEIRVLLGTPSAWATLGVSRSQRPARFTVALEGTRGRAEVDLYGDRLILTDGGGGAFGAAARDGLARLGGAAALLDRTLRGRRDPYAGLGRLLDRFYDTVRNGGPPPVALAELDAVHATVDTVLSEEVRICM